VFDEQKLRWMNGRYLREMDPAELAGRLETLLGREGLLPAVEVAQEKMQTLSDFMPLAGFLLGEPVVDEKAWAKVMKDGAAERLAAAREALAPIDPFEVEPIEAALRELCERLEEKPNKVFQPIRVAITGGTVSPGIFESLTALGREESLKRIDSALERLSAPV
jgi:glutamyl/glutaminyl-tRNA synthetase